MPSGIVFNPNNHDIVFLSYDEPNADENYQHLLSIKPKAMRVHGVKGSDAAHKACAELAKTERVIIIDGDNHVLPNLWHHNIYTKTGFDWSDCVFSWSSINNINGTQYGYGSIKCWPVHVLKNMQTHENSVDGKFNIDFDCTNYLQLNKACSYTKINTTPKQAFRAGFREATKLVTSGGDDFSYIDWRNFDRLYSWLHVGSDVDNGIWAIYGARLAVNLVMNGWEYTQIQDFDYLESVFEGVSHLEMTDVLMECERLGEEFTHFKIEPVFDELKSIIYKNVNVPPVRSPETFMGGDHKMPVYDIVFISYDEPHADENYAKLLQRFPKAKRVEGVKGIHKAHKLAARISTTDYFWAVDCDAEIVDSFNFEYEVPFFDIPRVRVWRSKNPVNGLVYGYGGVKLLPRCVTAKIDTNTTDMTTSISKDYEPIMELSNITRFNTDPFSTWRSAFRECCKLASNTIDSSPETQERLNIWCTVAEGDFSEYAIKGAISGREYGTINKADKEALLKINDYDWLRQVYDRETRV